MQLFEKHMKAWDDGAETMRVQWEKGSEWMSRLSAALRGGSILDVGCGQGHLLGRCPGILHRYRGVDFSSGMLENASLHYHGVPFSKLNVKSDPIPKADIIVCLNMLMYFNETLEETIEKLWASARRKLIFSIPLTPGETTTNQDHTRFNSDKFDNFINSLRAYLVTIEEVPGISSSLYVLQKNVSNKKISVITPCYNQDRHLPAAIESVLGQMVDDFEYILVNDGSTDRSLEIMQEYGRKDNRIKIVDIIKQFSIAEVLNAGLKSMTGEVFVWMPADDRFYPDLLYKKLKLADEHPDGTIFYSAFSHINDLGQTIGTVHPKQIPPEDFFKSCFDQCFIGFTGIWIPMINFERYGLFPEHLPFSEDYYWMLRASKLGARFVGIPDVLYEKRLHDNRMAVRRSSEISAGVVRIKEEISRL